MTDGIRIAVHHQECILSPSDHQVRSVVARLCRLGKKIEITRFLFEILNAPWSPERLQFFFWKFFCRHSYPPIRVGLRTEKSSQHFDQRNQELDCEMQPKYISAAQT